MRNGGLKDFIDLRIFPVDHLLYCIIKKGQLGMLKSETAGILTVEAIRVAPKISSVLNENGKARNTTSGVNH